jgi:chlorophyll synthase
LGIAIVNDFKSIEGDRTMGLQSLPVAFGVDTGGCVHLLLASSRFKGVCATALARATSPTAAAAAAAAAAATPTTAAKWICVSTIDVTQLGVAAYLYAGLGQTTYAAVLLGLILPQVCLSVVLHWLGDKVLTRCRDAAAAWFAARVAATLAPPTEHPTPLYNVTTQMFFQAKYLIPDPIANDVKYQAAAQPFLVFGLLTTALAIGHVNHIA